jgi:RNA polymerase sigma-70 factor (ECF subfamily)
MMKADTRIAETNHEAGSLNTTRWSLILRAREATPAATRALNELCSIYWYPVYCYIRRRGYQPAAAEDLVQGFFVDLLERDLFGQANRDRGKFRGLLISRLKYFLADEHKHTGAQKRGGHATFASLDIAHAEEMYARELIDERTPEALFDHRWAVTVLNRALSALAADWSAEKRPILDALMPHLLKPLDAARNLQVAEKLGLSESNVKVTLHRLRARYREALRQQIAETVSTEVEIEEELAALRRAI